MLSTEKIVVSYGRSNSINQLTELSLSISCGEITAIVGPNGSGKSTLVRSLSRVLAPQSGFILLDGKNLYTELNARKSAQEIGVVPQDTHVAFDFTCRDLVAMGLSPYRSGLSSFAGESAEESGRIDRALESVGLSSSIAQMPVMSLSGGERQRALIARAFIQQCSVILLDEPTSSLDLFHQSLLFEKLKYLAKEEHKAIVVVLHDLETAAAHADRIVMLSQGRIAADGHPKDVLTSQNIAAVYQVRSFVSTDYLTGRLHISVIPPSSAAGSLAGRSYHVICGGGAGTDVIRSLISEGALVTAGHLQSGDQDRWAAETYGISFSPLNAFEDVPELNTEQIVSLVGKCDGVIFCPAAVSASNRVCLDQALWLARRNFTVYSLWDIDYHNPASQSGGDIKTKASELFALKSVIKVKSLSALIDLLNETANA